MNLQRRLGWALLVLRSTVFLVMLMWTLDKLLRPGHVAGVVSHFYAMPHLGPALFLLIGVLELLLLLAFVLGVARRFTYAAVLVLHGASTLAAWSQYLHPYASENLMFFAAWPMLAACLALYLLREADAMSIEGWRRAVASPQS
ncbi:MAG: hypothetical protein KJS83_05665 [Xanthomonadaceae bacterium]|nr:hypothetical protein [Xanthomonadaceae bacterium]